MKKQKTLPYYKLYPSDLMSKTARLTDEQFGAYIRLLNEQWLSGDIPLVESPDGAGALRMICESADRSWPAIQKYFDIDGDGMKNPRMEKERIKAIDLYNKKVKAGRSSRAPDIAPDIAPVDITHNSELITKELKKSEHKKRVEALFLDFYSDYPKKVGKAQAQKAFHKISPDDDLFNVIITALKNHTRKWDDPKYIPHPATWLNQKRWEDALEVPTLKPKEKPPIQSCSLCSNKFEADMNTYLEFGGMCPECRKTNTITAV